MTLTIPMRTSRGLNAREHHFSRARRVKREKSTVGWELRARRMPRPALPCVVTLTRVAPSTGLDDDNLSGAMKNVRDAVAEWLGVDDKLSAVVAYRYAQRNGPWAVEITFDTQAVL